MNVHLVLVHGRAQEYKDGAQLKRDWLGALKKGLEKSGLGLPLPESRIHFPYYGQALYDLWKEVPADQVAQVAIKGPGDGNAQQQEFMTAVLQEVQLARGVSDEQVRASAGIEHVPQGVLQWEWVQGILAAIDTHVPGASGLSLALATNDVYQYLHNERLGTRIRDGVARALPRGEPAVVVSHSLGTVVAYDLLHREEADPAWRIPFFVTLGSPLAVQAIRVRLRPHRFPAGADAWYNALDPNDVVALYPLDGKHFELGDRIENKKDVVNHTPNQHGIVGYLDDAVVARRIHDALVQAQRLAAQ